MIWGGVAMARGLVERKMGWRLILTAMMKREGKARR
jgi:hypothetical protein